MAGILKDINFQGTDLNTVKELCEDGWRKAEQEELNGFLGFYLKKKASSGGLFRAQIAAVVLFFIFAGELAFEMLCKNDPSYDPVPMAAGTVCFALLIPVLFCVRRISLRKAVNKVKPHVYVTDALAYGELPLVCVSVNNKKLAFDKYRFDEPVNPMDKVYSANGNCEGFRVLLYAVVENNSCVMKAVLGSSGVRYYAGQYGKFEKNNGGLG